MRKSHNLLKIFLVNIFSTFCIFLFIELLSGYIIAFRSNPSLIWNSQIIEIVKKLKYKFSEEIDSPKLKKLKKLQKEGKKPYLFANFDPQAHSHKSIYWLTHPTNSLIVYCDEGGGVINFRTNKFGFRKTINEKIEEPLKYIFIGDSYIDGACVNSPNTIPDNIAYLSNSNVLNAGRGGSGPLYQLAILKEIIQAKNNNLISFKKNAEIIWVLFSGNDLQNIAEEKSSRLSNYLNDWNANYFEKKEDLSIIQKDFLSNMANNSKEFLGINNHGYGETVKTSLYSAKENLKEFEIIFNEFAKEVEKANLALKIISLEGHPHYGKNLMSLMEESIQKNCNLNKKVKCLLVNINDFKKSKNIGHFTENEYRNLSNYIFNELNL